ncbi:MAG: hypothetical protein ACJ76Y_08655 [Thermoanaerobaculia bacterium]
MPTLHRLGGAFTLLLCLAVPSVPAWGQDDEPLQAFRDGAALTLLPADGGARIELPGGRAAFVALPGRAEVSAFAAIDGGWVAAGSVPDAAGGRKLFLVRGNESASRPMAEPPGQEEKLRRGPVLLVDGGRLAGIAWLEGDGGRALSVCASLWTGKRWQAPERVSFPGPGTQTALAGAVLADGSWLLAWSAFDGQDDEIVWARRQGDAWQPVRRLTSNSVPDIVPALTATADGGALIAWSRLEDTGGYQMRMARFARDGWQGEHAAAALGSLYPTFLGPSRLLYLDAAAPRSWSVLDLDSQGRVKAKASVASTLERPAVAFEGGQVRMRWPTAKRQAAAPLERVP